MLKMTQTQKTDFLLALYITCLVSSELLGNKVASFWGINASVGIFTISIVFMVEDVVTEVFGKARARSFVRNGLVMLIFLLGFTLLATVLPPAGRFSSLNPAYVQIFSTSARIIVASLTAFFVGEMLDIAIYTKIREKLGPQRMWLRHNIANFIGEFFDTFLFMMMAFYVPGHFWFVMSLVWPYWLLKCGLSLVETPLTYLGVGWLKKV